MRTSNLLHSIISNNSKSRSSSPAITNQFTGSFGFYQQSHSVSKPINKKD